MAIKIVIGHQGRSKTVELADAKALQGKRIGETFKGELIDLTGYELQITGGADKAGFPMRSDVDGQQRTRILAIEGVGLKKQAKGVKQRKTVSGNTVGPQTAMVNAKVVKAGKQDLFEEPKTEEAEASA